MASALVEKKIERTWRKREGCPCSRRPDNRRQKRCDIGAGISSGICSGIGIADYCSESCYAARGASGADLRRGGKISQGVARASCQAVGRGAQVREEEASREVERDFQEPSRMEEGSAIRAAHFSKCNHPAESVVFDALRTRDVKKEIICTAESEPEFEHPVALKGIRLAISTSCRVTHLMIQAVQSVS